MYPPPKGSRTPLKFQREIEGFAEGRRKIRRTRRSLAAEGCWRRPPSGDELEEPPAGVEETDFDAAAAVQANRMTTIPLEQFLKGPQPLDKHWRLLRRKGVEELCDALG